MLDQKNTVFTELDINKKRTASHQSTEVAFNISNRHKIKVELIGQFPSTTFIVHVDGKEEYRKSLYPVLLQFVRYSFEIDGVDCSVKYFWLSGIWQGHIHIGGSAVV